VFPDDGPIRPEIRRRWCFIILSPYNTDFVHAVKISDFLFFNDVSKCAFSFSHSCTDHLGTEASSLLNFPL